MNPEDILQALLEGWSFNVEKISAGPERRPDFYVTNGNEKYLIEVKSKHPNPETEEERKRVLLSGEIYSETLGLERNPKRTKIISEGKNQLKYQPDSGDIFRLMCITCQEFHAETYLNQFEVNLYGSTNIVDFSESNGASLECYYFDFSDFYRYREFLDAVILLLYEPDTGFIRAKFCINNHSIGYNSLKETSLFQKFLETESVVDPPDLERKGQAYLVDSDIDRRKQQDVLNYVRKKYSLGKLTMNLNMQMISGELAVSKKKKS